MRFARVCPNNNHWSQPDDGNKGGIGTTFPGTCGFGFEEWLGRTGWIWNGPGFDWMSTGTDYHCGFIQAFRRQPEQAIHDVELFIINANSNRVAVGHINQCRRLTAAEIAAVFQVYNANGWIAIMQQELSAANQQAIQHHQAQPYPHQLANLGHAPHEIFNACFRISDLHYANNPVPRRYQYSRYGILYH